MIKEKIINTLILFGRSTNENIWIENTDLSFGFVFHASITDNDSFFSNFFIYNLLSNRKMYQIGYDKRENDNIEISYSTFVDSKYTEMPEEEFWFNVLPVVDIPQFNLLLDEMLIELI